MPTFAIVPVQHLETAKSRLAPLVSPGDRRMLVLDLLDNVLSALRSAKRVDQIVVVSPDAYVLQRSAPACSRTIRQQGRGLNEAIRLGRDQAMASGAGTLLVVLADLPRLTATEIDRLLELASEVDVTLAPDRHGQGTNALVLSPPDAIEPAFGIDSLRVHRTEARSRNRSFREFQSPGTQFDVDTVEDLRDLGWLPTSPHHNRDRADGSSLMAHPRKVRHRVSDRSDD